MLKDLSHGVASDAEVCRAAVKLPADLGSAARRPSKIAQPKAPGAEKTRPLQARCLHGLHVLPAVQRAWLLALLLIAIGS